MSLLLGCDTFSVRIERQSESRVKFVAEFGRKFSDDAELSGLRRKGL